MTDLAVGFLPLAILAYDLFNNAALLRGFLAGERGAWGYAGAALILASSGVALVRIGRSASAYLWGLTHPGQQQDVLAEDRGHLRPPAVKDEPAPLTGEDFAAQVLTAVMVVGLGLSLAVLAALVAWRERENSALDAFPGGQIAAVVGFLAMAGLIAAGGVAHLLASWRRYQPRRPQKTGGAP